MALPSPLTPSRKRKPSSSPIVCIQTTIPTNAASMCHTKNAIQPTTEKDTSASSPFQPNCAFLHHFLGKKKKEKEKTEENELFEMY